MISDYILKLLNRGKVEIWFLRSSLYVILPLRVKSDESALLAVKETQATGYIPKILKSLHCMFILCDLMLIAKCAFVML